MIRRAALVLLALGACGESEGPPLAAAPQRIVSLDHCADIHVLALAETDAIAAVSPGAGEDYTFLNERAADIPVVRPSAEDVLLLKPDLIVRSYGGGPRATELFRRAGVPVVELGWAATLDDVAANTERLGAALGAPEKGAALAADLRQQIAQPAEGAEQALYVTPSGVTTGPGSLVDQVLSAAGLENYETRPGWHPLPLERLAYESPDRLVTGFFDSRDRFEGRWDSLRHPVARDLMALPRTDVPGALLGCAAFPLGEAIRLIREGRE
ncbi:ABC transporter substrate-binding protein [Parvularcula lutaonensis]|uniref:ABC transporter substrate-binding protein n=1 Tax=Parvularcula lutaonensis TaxID=491923 RepID=A0ABV7M717_9PROT|nr:ABC transporter substrate-binding protein [Parvularcula lutaonensis]GGY56236.1 iron ABC transporter substrate-binding protein [Parvularcula lutaonensis]